MNTNTVLNTLGDAASAFGPWGAAIGGGMKLISSFLPDPDAEARKQEMQMQDRMTAFAGGTPLVHKPEEDNNILKVLGSAATMSAGLSGILK